VSDCDLLLNGMNHLFDDTNLGNPHKKWFFNALTAVTILLAVFLGVKAINTIKEYSYIGKGVYPTNTITVSGTGEVFSIPDTGSFSFSVNETGKAVKDAQDKASTKMNAILEALKGMGIEDKDIKTVGYNSGPKYEWRQATCPPYDPSNPTYYCPPGKNILTGYEVSQTISVKVRKTDDAGVALTKVGELGATNISSLEFVVDDMDAVKAEARDKAITDAKDKAKVLSKSLGINLVKIISFSDSGDYPPVYYGASSMELKAMGGDAVPAVPQVPVGENKIVSNVSITYEVR
jgi:uncharacterized protein YggE